MGGGAESSSTELSRAEIPPSPGLLEDPAAMSRGGGKGLSLKDKLDGNELDLSLCDLNEVPVRELVSVRPAGRHGGDGAQPRRPAVPTRSLGRGGAGEPDVCGGNQMCAGVVSRPAGL